MRINLVTIWLWIWEILKWKRHKFLEIRGELKSQLIQSTTETSKTQKGKMGNNERNNTQDCDEGFTFVT